LSISLRQEAVPLGRTTDCRSVRNRPRRRSFEDVACRLCAKPEQILEWPTQPDNYENGQLALSQ